MKIILAVIASLLTTTLFLPGVANAACSFGTGNVARTGNLTFGNVVVQRDAPVGTVLATTSVASSSSTFKCTTNYNYAGVLNLFTTPSSYGNKAYNTNISGVALILRMGGRIGESFPFSKVEPATSTGEVGGTITATLVKTTPGAVGSGPLTTGRLSNVMLDSLNGYNIDLVGVNNITPVACSVTNTAINVPMGDIPRRIFTGLGSAGVVVPFSVPLNCDAATRVNITVDASADSSAVPGVMAIDGSTTGAASGVGIQLVRNNTPVAFGTLIPIGTSTTGGVLNIPFTARYYQTRPSVTAGKANATATFTMTYN